MYLSMKLCKPKRLLIFLCCVFTAYCFAENGGATVFSADGKYTYDQKYLSVQVIEAEIILENANLNFKGELFNPSSDTLNKVELVIDLYREHDLLKSVFTPIFQCKRPLRKALLGEAKVSFSVVCANIPKSVLAKYKEYKISIGKQ